MHSFASLKAGFHWIPWLCSKSTALLSWSTDPPAVVMRGDAFGMMDEDVGVDNDNGNNGDLTGVTGSGTTKCGEESKTWMSLLSVGFVGDWNRTLPAFLLFWDLNSRSRISAGVLAPLLVPKSKFSSLSLVRLSVTPHIQSYAMVKADKQTLHMPILLCTFAIADASSSWSSPITRSNFLVTSSSLHFLLFHLWRRDGAGSRQQTHSGFPLLTGVSTSGSAMLAHAAEVGNAPQLKVVPRVGLKIAQRNSRQRSSFYVEAVV